MITALEGQRDAASVRALTLDGAVKCLQGRLPPPSLLERFENIQHLSIANTGVSSLQQFPRLRNLQKLILSDNRIAGGLEFLVEAGLESLRDLDLSNNRIQYIEDLAPLAQLKLVSLDLYECPVTRAKDYRARVFGLVKSLKFLDKMDAEGSERLESDEEEDEDEDEDDEYDPGIGEVDGEEDRPYNNGFNMGSEGIVDVDEDEESDADEEETDLSKRVGNGSSSHQANGFQMLAVDRGDEEDDEGEDEDNSSDSGEEIDEEDGDEELAEVHEVEESDDDGEFDALEVDDDGEDDDEENEEEVDNEEGDLPATGVSVRLGSIEGVIDGHEHGEEEGAEDDNGETGEEEPLDDDGDFDEEEEEDYGADYRVLPVGQAEEDGYADLENEAEDLEGEEVEDGQELPSSLHPKRKRGDNGDDNNPGDDEDDDDSCDDDSEDDDIVDHMNSSKKLR